MCSTSQKLSVLAHIKVLKTAQNGLQENHGIAIAVNTMIAGVCRDSWQSPWFCVTAVIIGGLCVKSAQCSFSGARLALQLTAAFTAMAQAEISLKHDMNFHLIVLQFFWPSVL